MIECSTLVGKRVLVPKDQLAFRLSVYGVVLWKSTVLLMSGRTSGRLWFPGGGLKVGERMEETLVREFLEETGVGIRVVESLTFKEEFFFHDVWRRAFHSFRFYFLCSPLTLNLVADDQVVDGESTRPRWMATDSLSPSSFDQSYGFDVLQLAMKRFESRSDFDVSE